MRKRKRKRRVSEGRKVKAQEPWVDWYNRGNDNLRQDMLPEAIICYEKALRLKPDLIEARNNIGQCLLRLERFDEAVECYEALARRDPSSVTYNNLATAYLHQSKFQEALDTFKKALEKCDDPFPIWTNIGVCYHKLGNYSEATRAYHEGLKHKPTDHKATGKLFKAEKMLRQARELLRKKSRKSEEE